MTIWTDETQALLGTMPDAHLARQLGCSMSYVHLQRTRLGIPAHGRRATSSGAAEARRAKPPKLPTLQIDQALAAKLDELAPLIAERFRALGLPVRSLEPWQVVEFCVEQVLQQARRERTRALYRAGAEPVDNPPK